MNHHAAVVLLLAVGCSQNLGKLGIIEDEDAGRSRDAAAVDASDASDAGEDPIIDASSDVDGDS